MIDEATAPDEALRQETLSFRDSFDWVVFATAGTAGRPLASYAPCIPDDAGGFYVFLSSLAAHTRQLVGAGAVSLLFLENREAAANPFARRRLTYDGAAIPVPRDAPQWAAVLDRFAERFGSVMDALRRLGDFQLFRIVPRSATYVRGFGQAYRLEGPTLRNIQHLAPASPAEGALATQVAAPAGVLDFWYSEQVRPLWFRYPPALDEEIRQRFLATYRAAVGGALLHWTESPEGALALVIVLDQFPLHMFRGRAEAFAAEAQGRSLVLDAVARHLDEGLSGDEKTFLYMPLMHSEALEDQDRAVELYHRAALHEPLKWAREHRDIIRRFGRFPHRNAILGRETSPEEAAYLSSEQGFPG
jgi:uncharacterized protein (DUF924 family)